MKLCRIGSVGEEKPAIIDSENNYRDLSSIPKRSQIFLIYPG